MYDQLMYEDEKPKLHEWNLINRPKQVICEALSDRVKKKPKRPSKPPITWTVSDIAKAGCLLCCPPKETSFEDEQEMRRVYSLIYDVFRYKYVLNQALSDVRFYKAFPNLVNSAPHVWLLLFDLYHRQFQGRIEADAALAAKLFPDIGLTLVENALWTKRVKLAAAVARLRIKHNALELSEMLPEHLRNEKVIEFSKTNPVTCWVNCYKVNDTQQLCKDIESKFNLKMVVDSKELKEHTFVWDRHCPQIIGFHSSMRDKVAKSDFVKEHKLIVQDKSFCLGPATFYKLVVDLELTGSVIQSHVNSPRTTAYLATLLARNERIKRLMAFSAGNRKNEYERYFKDLGMTNVVIFSDRLIDTPPDASYMEEVVAVFATPPNSYSAVVDPIDLVCSRGGDLSMLEVLTESGETKEAKQRVSNILDEQKKTLRFAMSRPQIQFVLYETHSALDVENTRMVEKAMTEINKVAKLHHAALQGSLFNTSQEEKDSNEINNNENGDKEKIEPNVIPLKEVVSSDSQLSESEKENSGSLLDKVQVPDTDVFDTSSLPRLCPSQKCRNFEKEGCYLALIQRKQVIRLDDKYMIQMAEHRGLFGSNTTTASQKSKSGRPLVKKKEQKQDTVEKPRKKLRDVEIDRIAAPTHTFLRHSQQTNIECCHKLETIEEDARVQSSLYRQWWKETTRHIRDLKKNLVKKKIVPVHDMPNTNVKSVVDSWNHLYRVDEIVKHANVKNRIPVYPKLKLKRIAKSVKVQVPLTVTSVEFLPAESIYYM
ncbi:unnamed protein product [Acanthoscelides obtectus]|nr:unnamed protein product [Acanthoscelides obtectus]CAH1971252.1 unnamed protein product [Acanthoscelides obtectus]CAK1676489.1 Putative methyltransferase NSUN7 [Acanthoscelides obtectus]CAK1676492.1 Putative methyltransferase NSUN7 [Acanthoscelides obtectus]